MYRLHKINVTDWYSHVLFIFKFLIKTIFKCWFSLLNSNEQVTFTFSKKPKNETT